MKINFDDGQLRDRVMFIAGTPLRREGMVAKLCLAALGEVAPTPQVFLWTTRLGHHPPTLVLLETLCQKKEEMAPFDFLASHSSFVAPLLNKHFPDLRLSLFFPCIAKVEEVLEDLQQLAKAWVQEGRFQKILCAHVEPGSPHEIELIIVDQ